MVVGCCHAGLVNTLRYSLDVSGEPRLHAVLGGFHLAESGEARLSRTLAALRELNPDLIVPCRRHRCSSSVRRSANGSSWARPG